MLPGPSVSAEMIRAALADPDPLTRTVAARLVGIQERSDNIVDLERSIETETDQLAEAEMVRALLYINGNFAYDALQPRLRRAAAPARVVAAHWVGLMQPATFADRLPQLAAGMGAQVGALQGAVVAVVRSRPDLAAPVLRAWLAVAPPQGWSSVIRHWSVNLGAESQAGVVLEALASTDTAIREATVWMLLFRLSESQPVPTAILDRAADSVPSRSEPTWETFGRELIGRHLGRELPARPALLAAEAARHIHDAQRIPALNGIPRSELDVLRNALGERYRERKTLEALVFDYSKVERPMRSLPLPWPGLLASLIKEAGCTLSAKPLFASVHSTYLADGRRDRAKLDVTTMPSGCDKVVEALVRLMIADPEHVPAGGAGEWVLIPMDAGYLACSSSLGPPDSEPLQLVNGADSRIKAPSKTRDVRPDYPQAMQRQRVQGVVVVEGRISTAGCPTMLRVVRGIHPALDAAALEALAGWRYTPSELDDVPVAVAITLTVSFSLR